MNLQRRRDDRDCPAVYGPSPRHAARLITGPSDVDGWMVWISVRWPQIQDWLLANCTQPVYYGTWQTIEFETFFTALLEKTISYPRQGVDFKPMIREQVYLPPDVIEFDSKADLMLFMLFYAEEIAWISPAADDH